ncbi:5'-flap endonuclease [Sporothrix curviconia]|uniref:Structure-specific endonuclease subunit SLX4 n=1 Tax=Sporothrix curviconia TaxID=1260050 RepID=A0ABP0C7V0_9PEZI
MARSDTRDLRDVILLSSSPVLPPQRPLSSLKAYIAPIPNPAWGNKHLLGSDTVPTAKASDLIVLGSTSDAAADDGPRPSQTFSKYFDDADAAPADDTPSLPAAKTGKARPMPEAYVTGDLELAIQRRRDWTPPPNDTAAVPGSAGSPLHAEDWSSSPGDILSRRSNVFKSLQTNYGCKENDEPAAPASTTATIPAAAMTRDSSFTKRKAIEAISTGDTGRKTSPTKTKAPKKKVRTLTELAVAAYADAPAGDDDASTYTTTTTTAMMTTTTTKRQLEAIDEYVPLAEVEVRQGFPTSKLRKLKSTTGAAAAAKTKKAKPRAKKAPAPRKPVLLSPASARTASNAQDFLFGTSSQLASEHSPTFLRHLHTAMQESNQNGARCGNENEESEGDDDRNTGRNRLLDILADMSSEPDIPTVDLTGQRTPAPGERKRLWGAAARGADGHLSFDNVIDLEDAIEFPEDPHQVIAMAQRAAAEAVQKDAQEATPVSTAAAAATASTQKPTQKPKATQSTRGKGKQATRASPAQANNAILPTPAQTAQTAQPAPAPTPAPTMVAVAKAAKATKSRKAVKEKEAVRPNFDILSTAQLAKKVSDYGYKAMKARPAMVALLNQCWDAQHPPPSGQQTPSDSPPSATAPVPAPAHAPATAQTANAAADSGSPVKAQTQAQIKLKTARVTKLKAANAAPTTKATQTTISGTTTLPRSSISNAKAVAGVSAATNASIHTTAKAAARTTARTTAQTTASSKPERLIYEIDDSESDGRFSSPEPNTAATASHWGIVEGEEDVVNDSDFLDIDDIVASDLDDTDGANDGENDNNMSLVADAPLTYEESALFQYISTAVTQQPRTSDPTAPSWHEKILMYDTIILETFTAWLNGGPLQAAGYAGTAVDPPTVKKWCESKSVCCIWRKNQHGKERKW